MRRLFLFVLLTPLTALAQPSAADSPLADRLIHALRYDEDVSAAVSSTDSEVEPGAPTPIRLADSVRVALAEDYRPALLEEALTVLEGPAHQRVEDATRDWMRGKDSRTVMALMQTPAPPEAARADSALVARYVDAQLSATQPDDIRIASLTAARDALADSARAALDAIGVWSSMMDPTGPASAARTRQRAMTARVTRLQLADVDPADIEALTAYYRSEAGRYVGRQIAIGASRAQLPVLVESLETMAQQVSARSSR